MGAISRYIFRTTFSAFVIVLVSVTGVIWIFQSLRYMDLVTNQGQTLLAFVGITSLTIPFLAMTIAPIALLIAVLHALNKLSNDSELISMNAAGMSPWQLSRAFMLVALIVFSFVLAISTYFGPQGLRMLRDRLTKVNSDVVSMIAKPNHFTTIQNGVTLFMRARDANGRLLGVLIEDRRNPNESTTLIAKTGAMINRNNQLFLRLKDGVLQRHNANNKNVAMIEFDNYAFDLSQFTGNGQEINYSIREHYLWDLLLPKPDDESYKAQPARFRAEFHDRIIAPFYAITFTIIALACMCVPRSNRKKAAVLIYHVIGWVAILRILGIICSIRGASSPWVLLLPYAAIAVVFAVGIFVIGSATLPTTAMFRIFGGGKKIAGQ